MARVGVFVCHCGTNIAGIVDVEGVAEAARKLPFVKFASDYKYFCSRPGQTEIIEAIKKHQLDRVVVSSCSPSLHEKTFRACVEEAGLNPFMVEMANIREQCSWVHKDKEKATQKAIELVRAKVAKISRSMPLKKMYHAVEKKVLVIGGGIAGIQAALDIAIAGFKVIIVEKEPSIGGRMAQFDKTFPTLDCSACILTPRMVTASQHENIKIYSYSEVSEVDGFVGNFNIKILKKARSVNEEKCTGCGQCITKCPSKVPSEFDRKLGLRKAIYTPFPQAVPNVPVIDRPACRFYTEGKCRVCEKICQFNAIDFSQEDQIIEEKVGAIIVATGFTLFDHKVYGEYGYGKFKNVITGLDFERMVNSSGPTGGHVVRPSDNKPAKNVVFIQCVGSRDEQKGVPYCSRLCCMYTAKHALLLREHDLEAQAYVFYIDVRAAGKGYEEFVKKAQTEYGAMYLRGRVSRIFEKDESLIVRGADTLSGSQIEIKADMVVLATGLVARPDAPQLAKMLSIPYDKNNLFTEAHPKLGPVETVTSGIFLTGACQAPKDIPDTVATASAASVKALGLITKDELTIDPEIASVNPFICSGCLNCVNVCPFSAIETEEFENKMFKEKKTVAKIIDSLCRGCGACTGVCRVSAIDIAGYKDEQIMEELKAL